MRVQKSGQPDNRKGFLFVVTIFLILTYILLSISVWVKSIETAESGYSEMYKESNVELAMSQITQAKIESATSMVMNRGLFVLNNYSIDHPLNTMPGDQDYYIQAAFGQWLLNGSPGTADFVDGTAPSEPDSSMTGWMTTLNNSMSAIGVYVDGFTISDFNISQSDIQTLNYSYDMSLSMADFSGTTSVSRSYDISGSVNITGLPDPAIARASAGPYQILGRRFYFYSGYTSPSDLAPQQITTGSAGQGWLYGYLVDAKDAASVPSNEEESYILVGSYSDVISADDFQSFGGYIVTTPITDTPCTVVYANGSTGPTYQSESDTINPLTYSGTACTAGFGSTTSNPFVVAPGFDISQAPTCTDLNTGSSVHCALIMSATPEGAGLANSETKGTSAPSPPQIYNIERIRDYTMCGYYIADPNAPSYMQRLLNDSYRYQDNAYGISTFLIGTYVNASIGGSSSGASYSRLDYEMFNQQSGTAIRGLPGCKDVFMCGDTPDTGIFTLGTDAISEYGLSDITCKNGMAGCD